MTQIEKSIYRLFEITPIPIALSFPDGRLEYVNPALKAMLGYEGEHIYADEVTITHLDDLKLNMDIRAQLKSNPCQAITVDKRYLHNNGSTVYAQLNIVGQVEESGEIKRFISQIIDLTKIKKADAAEILLNYLVNQSNDAVYVVDPNFGQILNCNQLAYRRLGYTKAELLTLTVAHLNPVFQLEGKWQQHVEKIRSDGSLILESTHTRKDGTDFFIEASISFIEYDKKNYLIAIVRDISRRKKKEQEALEKAGLDPLTKLPDRRVLEDKLTDIFEKAKKRNSYVAFIYIDLDNFKELNDNYGHGFGDDVLVSTANRLKHTMRKSDLVIRLGGDEFLVVIPNIENKPSIELLANKVIAEFNSPFKIQTKLVQVEASLGVSVYSGKGGDAHTLIQLADEAMYQAKKHSGTSIYYL